MKNLEALERNAQVKSVNITKTSRSFLISGCLYATSVSNDDSWSHANHTGVMFRTALSSSLASTSSGSVVTEGVLGLNQEICSTRPLNLAPWLAAWKTKQKGKLK